MPPSLGNVGWWKGWWLWRQDRLQWESGLWHTELSGPIWWHSLWVNFIFLLKSISSLEPPASGGSDEIFASPHRNLVGSGPAWVSSGAVGIPCWWRSHGRILAHGVRSSAPQWAMASATLYHFGGWNAFSIKGWDESLSSFLFTNHPFLYKVRRILGLFTISKRHLFLFSYALFACRCLCWSRAIPEFHYWFRVRLFLLLPHWPPDWVTTFSYPQWPLLSSTWSRILYCTWAYGFLSLLTCL